MEKTKDGSLGVHIGQHVITEELATFTRARIAEELAQSTREIASSLAESTADIAERLASTEAHLAKRLEQQYEKLRHDWYAKQLMWNKIIVGLNLAIVIVWVVWLLAGLTTGR